MPPRFALPLALLATSSASASPLAANTSHVGEPHSFEVHTSQNLKGIDEDRDGHGDACHGLSPLPEPGPAALFAEISLLAALATRRRLGDRS